MSSPLPHSGTVTFADVVYQSVSFNRHDPAERLVLELVDSAWFQRLRDISQTANTKLVYMFCEHSRFGHSLGVSYLAHLLVSKLRGAHAEAVEPFRAAVYAAALLHDVGHLAPGSHTAFKAWFPGQPDTHEHLAVRILRGDDEIQGILKRYDPDLPRLVELVLMESETLPPWTWQLLSGSGWNVDRGNWCIVDSVMAGVSYGKYNIPALTESIELTPDLRLALRENRLDAMMHFAVSRHAMYRQIYQHRVLLAADKLMGAIVQRARDVKDSIPFADAHMRTVLAAPSVDDLSLENIFAMRESWFRYHLSQWASGSDAILADLSSRLLNRRLFKTVRVRDHQAADSLEVRAERACRDLGFDPAYYLHRIEAVDPSAGEGDDSMAVLLDDGTLHRLSDADPLFHALTVDSKPGARIWLAMPAQVKERVGISR